MLAVHDAGYLKAFKETSDAGGGDLGFIAPFGKGSYEIAALSAGLAMHAVDMVLRGKWKNAYSLSPPPPAITACASTQWASACSPPTAPRSKIRSCPCSKASSLRNSTGSSSSA
jgi:hypothetical protein